MLDKLDYMFIFSLAKMMIFFLYYRSFFLWYIKVRIIFIIVWVFFFWGGGI